MKKVTVKNVAEAQAMIQQIAPATYTAENSSLALGVKAKDRIEWYNAEKSSYCIQYKNGEADFINIFNEDDDIIATITIDNTVESTEEKAEEYTVKYRITVMIDGEEDSERRKVKFNSHGEARQFVKKIMTVSNFEAATIEPKNGFNSYHVYKAEEASEVTVANFTAEVENLVSKIENSKALGAHVTVKELEKELGKVREEYQKKLVYTTLAMEIEDFYKLYESTVANVKVDNEKAAVEVEEYAVSVDAQEVATQAEIDNAQATPASDIVAEVKNEVDATLAHLTTEVHQLQKAIRNANALIPSIQNGEADGDIEALQATADAAQKRLFELNETQFELTLIIDLQDAIAESEYALHLTPRDKECIQESKEMVTAIYNDYISKVAAASLPQLDLQSANDSDNSEEKIFVAYVNRDNGWNYDRKGTKIFNNATAAFNYLAKKHYKGDNWEFVIEVWDSEKDYNKFSGSPSFADHIIYSKSPDFGEDTSNPEIQELINDLDTITNRRIDDGSNDDPDEEDFLATLDTSVDEDGEDDELVDPPVHADTETVDVVAEFEVGKTYLYQDCFEEFADFLKVMARFKDGNDTYITVKDSSGNYLTFKVLLGEYYKLDGDTRYIPEYIDKGLCTVYSYDDVKVAS